MSKPKNIPVEVKIENMKSGHGLTQRVKKALETGDATDAIQSLTALQRKFAEEYVVDFNKTQAAVRAGSKGGRPDLIGFQMYRHIGVRFYIDHLLKERAAKTDIKPDYVLRKIVNTIEKAEASNNHAAVLRGAELLARHLGMFVEKTEITGKDGGALQYEKITKDADDFASTISRLAKRTGEDGAP